MRKQNKTLTCPECKGSGGEMTNRSVYIDYNATAFVPCYYCAGTGYQSDDDDSFEQFYKDI